MPTDIRIRLSKALTALDAGLADLVLRESTSITEYKVGFLNQYRIYLIEHFNPHKPILFYVAYASGQPTYVLTANPRNFSMLARSDGVRIDSQEAAVSYATVYLEVTRSTSSLNYVVGSVDEVKFRPYLSEAEEQTRLAFIKKYGPLIRPAFATHPDPPYLIEAYSVHEQELEHHAIRVDACGEIDDSMRIVECELPLVYGA